MSGRYLPGFVVAALAALAGFHSAALGQADTGEPPMIRMPLIDNPYCAVPTFVRPDVPEQARAMRNRDGTPVIHLNANIAIDKAYANYLMAHECCHHSAGHIDKMREQMSKRGETSFKAIASMVKEYELEADCCAAKLLKKRGETESLDAAKRAMTKFGGMPTGAYYPSGMERAFTISECAK